MKLLVDKEINPVYINNMKTKKLLFWASCVDVTDYTTVTTAELAQWDDKAVEVDREQFESIVDMRSMPINQDSIDEPELQWLVYPSIEEPTAAMIYDVFNDVHYIFI